MSSSLNGTGVTFSDGTSQPSAVNAVNGKVPSSSQINGVIVSGIAVASTSGTNIDFTSIPSWVKRITVMFNGVSSSGTSVIQLQLGSGSVSTSGYTCVGFHDNTGNAAAAYTSGFGINQTNVAAANYYGQVVFSLQSNNTWVGNGFFSSTGTAQLNFTAGVAPNLSGTLDRVRITTVNGTDTFDAGSINILYE